MTNRRSKAGPGLRATPGVPTVRKRKPSASPPKAASRARRDRTPPKKAAGSKSTPPPKSSAPAGNRWAKPEYLASEDGAAWWTPLVTELRDRGRLHLVQPVQVAQLCQLMAQWWRATNDVETRGRQVDKSETLTGTVRRYVSPEVRIQLSLLDAVRKLAKDLGLNEAPLSLKPAKDGGTNGGRDQLRKLLETALQVGDPD